MMKRIKATKYAAIMGSVHLLPDHEGESARRDGAGYADPEGNRPAADRDVETDGQSRDVHKAYQRENADGYRGEGFHDTPPLKSLSRFRPGCSKRSRCKAFRGPFLDF